MESWGAHGSVQHEDAFVSQNVVSSAFLTLLGGYFIRRCASYDFSQVLLIA